MVVLFWICLILLACTAAAIVDELLEMRAEKRDRRLGRQVVRRVGRYGDVW